MFVMIVGEISVFVCNKLHVNATVGAVSTLIYNTQPREQGSTSLTLDAISFHKRYFRNSSFLWSCSTVKFVEQSQTPPNI